MYLSDFDMFLSLYLQFVSTKGIFIEIYFKNSL